MAFLARQEIYERIQQGELIADADTQFKEKYLHQSSYDLRLGPEIYIVGDTSPKLLKEDQPYISFGLAKSVRLKKSDCETQTTFLSMPRNESGNSAKNPRNSI